MNQIPESHSGPVSRLMELGCPNYIAWENAQTDMSPKDVLHELWQDKATAYILCHYRSGVTNARLQTVDVLFITTRGEFRATIEFTGQLQEWGTSKHPGGRDEFKGNRPILDFGPFETKRRKH